MVVEYESSLWVIVKGLWLWEKDGQGLGVKVVIIEWKVNIFMRYF